MRVEQSTRRLAVDLLPAALVRLLFRPRAFFVDEPARGSLLGPLVTGLACIETATLLGEVLRMAGVRGVLIPWPFHQTVMVSGVEPSLASQTPEGLLMSVLVAPLAGALLLALVAGAGHYMVRTVAPAKTAGFGATFRVVCYSAVAALGAWVPYIGALCLVHAAAIGVAGVRVMHRLPARRAATAVVSPIALLVTVFGVMQVLAAVALLVFNYG